AVLAPGAGRVLRAPVAEGSVVLPGETIATIAEDHYILRLQLPERHARFLRAGDVVKIGARGLAEDGAHSEGRVRLVYPEIQGGRVIADVEAPGVGDYFVGERTKVYLITSLRQLQAPSRTEREHAVFAGVVRWRAIRSSSRKASVRPVSPSFTEPKGNVLGAMALITASSPAARRHPRRAAFIPVQRVSQADFCQSGNDLRFKQAAAAHLVQDDLPGHAIKEGHFQYRTRSTPRRHPDGCLDDEAQARSSYAGA